MMIDPEHLDVAGGVIAYRLWDHWTNGGADMDDSTVTDTALAAVDAVKRSYRPGINVSDWADTALASLLS